MSTENEPVFVIEDDKIRFPSLTDVSTLEEQSISFTAPASFSQRNDAGNLRPVNSLEDVVGIAENSANRIRTLVGQDKE